MSLEADTRVVVPNACGYIDRSSDDADVSISAHRYSENFTIGVGVYDVDREFGGTSPQQVYSSALSANTAVSEATDLAADVVIGHPEIAGGLVVVGTNGYLAGLNGFWYDMDLGGGVVESSHKQQTSYWDPFIVKVAQRLAAQ